MSEQTDIVTRLESYANHQDGRVITVTTDAAVEVRKLLAQVENLERFKAYVHKRLDDAGIPVDPESSHKAE